MYPVESVDFALTSMYSGMSSSISNLSMNMLLKNADDYTGASVFNDALRSRVAENNAKMASINDGISVVQVTQDSIAAIKKKLDQAKEIADTVAAGNYTPGELAVFQNELEDILKDINAIAAHTTPGNNSMLIKADSSISVSYGNGISVEIKTADLTVTGMGVISNIDLTADAQAVADVLESALGEVLDYATILEEKQKDLAAAAAVVDAQSDSLLATKSAIASTDSAMMMFSMLNGGSSSFAELYIISQANSNADAILKLLAD